MGHFHAKAASARPTTPARPKSHFRVRREEVTPALLQRIAQHREEGRLGSVVLDCRLTVFDAETLDTMERAAGVTKLVLEC